MRAVSGTLSIGLAASYLVVFALGDPGSSRSSSSSSAPGVVKCANLVYANNKTSVCFSDKFLGQIETDTHIRTTSRFFPVKLESPELFEHPFAVMTGQGNFTLTPGQRRNMRKYLEAGGFIVASAGCSSKPWNSSLDRELREMFPKIQLKELKADHPVFHTVYDVTSSKYKSGAAKLPILKGLEIDGKVVLIWSPDGLNDTKSVGGSCCCCGGNEVKSAKQVNVNLLAYALTH